MVADTLSELVAGAAARFSIPGVAAGIWSAGREAFACAGVTSLDDPLPVDPETLFLLGSVTKTYTAAAVLHLVAGGYVELEAPVRRYVPELRLADEQVTASVTVLQLLNHTAGLGFGFADDFGEGDDALTRYVARMDGLDLIAPPGTRASYSQAGYNLAGRIVEKVTGLTYERAVTSFILEPLGLTNSFYARDDVMTRRFVVGHNRDHDGTLSIARLWRRSRGDNPGGGLASSVVDQLHWARFHLGDPGVDGAERVLPTAQRREMQRPTVALRASDLGDAIGLGWFLRDVGGVGTVTHGGSANGQFADLLLVPERGFAVVALSNAFPDGPHCNQAIIRGALHTYLGVTHVEPDPLPYNEAAASQLIGSYENEVMTLTITADGRVLTLSGGIKPEIRAAADKELPPDYPPASLGLLPGDTDEYVVTSGGMKGARGFFSRNERGAVVSLDLAGRLFSRIQSSPAGAPAGADRAGR